MTALLVFLAVFLYRATISGTLALWRRSGAIFLWCSGGDLRPHSLLDGIYILSSFASGAQAAIWGHIRDTCVCQQTF